VTGLRNIDESERLLDALIPMTPDAAAVLRHLRTAAPTKDEREGGKDYFTDEVIAGDLGIGRSRVRVALRRLEEGSVAETIGSLWGGGEGWLLTDLAPEVERFLTTRG
jgi:hypothetical protein